jgi:hypothetical protein
MGMADKITTPCQMDIGKRTLRTSRHAAAVIKPNIA